MSEETKNALEELPSEVVLKKNEREEFGIAIDATKIMIEQEYKLRKVKETVQREKKKAIRLVYGRYQGRIDSIDKDIKKAISSGKGLSSSRIYHRLKTDFLARMNLPRSSLVKKKKQTQLEPTVKTEISQP
jgi:hypothetical protein